MRPWRSPEATAARPAVPLPPDRMAPLRAGRPLKAWRSVGVFSPQLVLCAAATRVGPARLSWWAVWDRGTAVLRARTYRRSGPVHLGPIARAGGASLSHVVDARAIVDDSAGYHARRTAWTWSAGVGVSDSGAQVAWSLCAGLHDAPQASERSVWVDGAVHEVAPVRFSPGLDAVAFAEGGELRFATEAVRARRENLLLVRSSHEQPFGTFAGELPGAGALREGFGVMERHEARW